MGIYEYVGDRIRDLRTSYGGTGISQELLAKKLEIATNTVSRWETATYHPTLADLEKIALFFGRPLSDFLPPGGAEGVSAIAAAHMATAANPEEYGALCRVASDLPDTDLREVRSYAEYRRTRALTAKRKKKGRPTKTRR